MNEFINKIELQGVVGAVGGGTFSLCTEHSYENVGERIVEVMWHSCVYFGEKEIKKGDWVHLVGRPRMKRYIGDDGEPRLHYEVIVNKIDIL